VGCFSNSCVEFFSCCLGLPLVLVVGFCSLSLLLINLPILTYSCIVDIVWFMLWIFGSFFLFLLTHLYFIWYEICKSILVIIGFDRW
jgi:hypothetical protein